MSDGAKIGTTIVAAIVLYALAVNPWSNPWLCLTAAIGAAICSGLCGLWLKRSGKERSK